MRFYVYKRALMLTAATIALLSGPAYAANNKTTNADGPIDIGSTQTLNIPSSSTPATVPAIEINSATASKNKVTIETGGSLTFTGTSAAIGIQADPGKTGEIILGGSMDLTGSGTGKSGILIGTGTGTTGTFTGMADTTNNTLTAGPTAIVLLGGSLLKVQGNASEGINLGSGDTVKGDIIINGSVEALPSTANGTTAGNVTGILLSGTTDGSLVVGSGGIVEGFGQGGQGVVVLGNVTQSIQNFGSILSSGTQATPSTDKGNPTPGSALVISNNVTGGIYNGGPLTTSDTTNGPGSISTNGNSPALLVTTGFLDSGSATPVTIGGFVDKGGAGTYSLINRGTISSSPQNINGASTGVEIIGTSDTNRVTLSDGFFNTGTIGATTSSDTNASATNPPVATGVIIGNFAHLDPGANPYAFTNANNGATSGSTGSGTISAAFSGQTVGVATGIAIATNASVPSLLNQGTITATATVTDTKVTSLTAVGILDQSGSLLKVTNEGSISAQAFAVVNGVAAPLDNRQNLGQALNLSNATGAITLNNSGTILGDVLLGADGDTVTTSGTVSKPSSINGNINFGGGADTLTVGGHSTVSGDILENAGGHINITVESSGQLGVTNNGATSGGRAIPTGTTANLSVSNLHVEDGGTLGLTLADGFNINRTGNAGPIVQASSSTATINLDQGSILKINFGGFVSAPELSNGSAGTAKFVVFDATKGQITIANSAQVQQALTDGIPFLFSGSACAYSVTGFTSCGAATGNPEGTTHSDVILTLTPKTAKQIGLTGYAATMFGPANLALADDAALGAAVINAGTPLDNKALTQAQGQKLYQQIYSSFAPDVTGSARAVAISLTDQASSIVGDRQRKLRMYAGQDGDVTLWAQEFGQRLSVPNKTTAGGYNNSGFGLAMGMDGGSISSGRYGGAFTFYAGDTSEKSPRTSKTNSQWYMLTAYSDWRGKHLFFDSDVSVGYGHLDGKRTLSIDDLSGATLITRTAQGKRSSEMAAGGFSTGLIFNSGGTVFAPQFSMDALTLREEGYTESGGGAGMDLRVQPYYANSVRAFLGADLRQDLKMGSYFLQPELRAGYRYDLVSGQEKLKVNFAGDQQVTPTVAPGSEFSITGPDPAKGNLVFGAGVAVTTDAWSIGVNYDYLRGFGGTKGTNQDAMLTLIGRI